MAPYAHLTADFNQAYIFRPTGTTVLVSRVVDDQPEENLKCLDASEDDRLREQNNGVILATATGNYALGLFRKNNNPDLGQVYSICHLFPGASASDGGGQYSVEAWMINANKRPGNVSAQTTVVETVQLFVGTFMGVREAMIACKNDSNCN